MKKLIALIEIVLCCLLMTSCKAYFPDYITFYREISPTDTITYNDEEHSITYNGIKYISANGKISADFSSEYCVKIATMPYSYLLCTVSVFYGDDSENPTIISCERTGSVWIREGTSIDDSIINTNYIVDNTFSFKLNDVITEESIPFSSESENRQALVSFENSPLEDYPAFSFHVDIIELDGELYLQYAWNSNFYKITDKFEVELRENGFIN